MPTSDRGDDDDEEDQLPSLPPPPPIVEVGRLSDRPRGEEEEDELRDRAGQAAEDSRRRGDRELDALLLQEPNVHDVDAAPVGSTRLVNATAYCMTTAGPSGIFSPRSRSS